MEHKEKQEIKWADVAHYYQKSEILIQTNDVGIREMLGAQGTRGVMYATRAHAMLSRWGQHKPILRALEDMTGDDAKELFMYLHGNYPIFEGTDSQLIALMLGKSFNLTDADGSRMLHWLIQRQFDVFGLIKSGQAIRKEMENK